MPTGCIDINDDKSAPRTAPRTADTRSRPSRRLLFPKAAGNAAPQTAQLVSRETLPDYGNLMCRGNVFTPHKSCAPILSALISAHRCCPRSVTLRDDFASSGELGQRDVIPRDRPTTISVLFLPTLTNLSYFLVSFEFTCVSLDKIHTAVVHRYSDSIIMKHSTIDDILLIPSEKGLECEYKSCYAALFVT